MNYVYIQSDKQENSAYLTGSLWTVGFYSPDGKWHPESDHDTPESAAERVHYLNGGNETENPYILHGAELERTRKARISGGKG